MARLSGSDYRAALDLLREAGAVGWTDPFPEHVLGGLRRLIPCDVVAYHEGPVNQPAVAYAGEPRGQVTQAIRDAHKRLVAQDVLTPVEGARKYSDYLSQRQFHRLAFYHEVARPLGVEDMIRLWIEPTGTQNSGLEFDRPDWGFRERDRTVLDLLLPHLRQLRRNAVGRRRPLSQGDGLTPREREVLALVAEGRTNTEVRASSGSHPERCGSTSRTLTRSSASTRGRVPSRCGAAFRHLTELGKSVFASGVMQ